MSVPPHETNPPPDAPPQRVAVVTCAVLELEIAQLARQCPNVINIVYVEQGLHNEPPKLRVRLQETIDQLEAQTDAQVIVLGYGLCSRGIEGVHTQRCQLVVARAHDCITLLLGSKERYAQYVKDHPGTYWYSPGWNKHHTPPGKERYERLYRQYVEKFGEDDAEYLMGCEQHWFSTYDRATYVHLSIGATDQDKQYTRDCADWLKWNYDEQAGDPALLKALMTGAWDEDRFVVLQPRQTIRLTSDERIFEAVDYVQAENP